MARPHPNPPPQAGEGGLRPQQGSGPTAVLIHGWGFDPGIWQPLREVLGARRVVLPALPGHGGRGQGERLADPSAAAREVEDQLPADLVEPVWIGWSLGGLVALALAQRWRGPQRLVLVNATPRFTVADQWLAALEPAALADFSAELERDRTALERRFTALCALGARAPARLRRELLARMGANPATAPGLRAGLQALATGDLRAVWSGLDAPVAAWMTRDDRLVPAGTGEALTALRPDAHVRESAGGHASWLEDPQALAGFVEEVMA
ncbi:MAG: alpha/beta fold hydrolase [Thioalkalivibrio sp.]|nr:MAG: alpha/beta fold hydrolase [Thioalkalivibrio sp.]